MKLSPDGILFVGDLGEADIKVVKAINSLSLPIAVILGNHDRGKDKTGELLQTQINLLKDKHCGWSLMEWSVSGISVVGARPCSAGGGFHLSEEVRAVYGEITLEESVNRIVIAAEKAPRDLPLIILAHSGPTGLGSEASSPCGRDWKPPALDWGDKDLALAIDKIRKKRIPDVVIFGHMHHNLKRGGGYRCTYKQDIWGTSYLNAACVPRKTKGSKGESLFHLSWIEFNNGLLTNAYHRWYRSDASVAYEETLFNRHADKKDARC